MRKPAWTSPLALLDDHAMPLAELLDRVEYSTLCVGLLAGYRPVRPLPPAHEELLGTFIALRRVQSAL